MNYSIRAFVFTLFLFNTTFTMDEKPADQELNGEELEIWYRATQQIVNRKNSTEKEIFDDLSALRRTSKLTRQAVDNFVAAIGRTRVPPALYIYTHEDFRRDVAPIRGFRKLGNCRFLIERSENPRVSAEFRKIYKNALTMPCSTNLTE